MGHNVRKCHGELRLIAPCHSTDVRSNPCDETPFCKNWGPSHPHSCDSPERPTLETTSCRDPQGRKSAEFPTESLQGRNQRPRNDDHMPTIFVSTQCRLDVEQSIVDQCGARAEENAVQIVLLRVLACQHGQGVRFVSCARLL